MHCIVQEIRAPDQKSKHTASRLEMIATAPLTGSSTFEQTNSLQLVSQPRPEGGIGLQGHSGSLVQYGNAQLVACGACLPRSRPQDDYAKPALILSWCRVKLSTLGVTGGQHSQSLTWFKLSYALLLHVRQILNIFRSEPNNHEQSNLSHPESASTSRRHTDLRHGRCVVLHLVRVVYVQLIYFLI